jgi:hypothetical protein
MQIVLVTVIAVLVKSQALCPSVCQYSDENATCTDLFSDVTNMTQHRFHSSLRRIRIVGSTTLENEDDLFLRWNITSLTNLDLLRINVRYSNERSIVFRTFST